MTLPAKLLFTAGALSVNLHDRSAHYMAAIGIDIGRDGVIAIPLDIKGRTHDELRDNISRIEAVIDESRRLRHAGLIGGQLLVSRATSNAVVYYAFDGHLDYGDTIPGARHLKAVLTLECLPTAYGDAVPLAESDTITNGDGELIVLRDVPGTADAVARLYLADVSTGDAVINRIRIGRVSGHDIEPGDYAGVIDAEAIGEGSTESDASAVGGSFARVTANSQWQTFAKTELPANKHLSIGEFDVLARWRDHAVVVPQPSNLLATPSPDGGVGIRHVARYALPEPDTSISIAWGQGGSFYTKGPISEEFGTTLIDSLLIAIVTNDGADITPPGGWTLATGFPVTSSDGGGSVRIAVYYIEGALPRSGTETFGFSVSNNGTLQLIEVRGIATSDALDQTATNTGQSSGPVTTGTTSATASAFGLALAVGAYAANGADGAGGVFGFQDWTNDFGSGSTEMGSPGPVSSAATDGFTSVRGNRTYTSVGTLSTSISTKDGTPANRRWAGGILAFESIIPEPASLDAALWTVRVAGVDANGNESIASDPIDVTVPDNGAIFLEWNAGTGMVAIDRWAVYLRRQGVDYVRFTTDDDTPQFIVTHSSGEEAEPIVGTVVQSQLRALIGMGSGTVLQRAGTIVAGISNGLWESDRTFTAPLPPENLRLDADNEPWVIHWQTKNDLTESNVDLDAVWLLPADEPSVVLEYHNGSWHTLETKRTWEYSIRPDGRQSCILLDGSGNEVGRAHITGALNLRHGDNYLIAELADAGGVSDVSDLKVRLVAPSEVRGGWRGLRGAF